MSDNRSPVTVSLKEFIRTGNFGPIPFGISREGLMELLGPTELTLKGSRRDRHPSIYKYGDFEFYVHPDDDRLHLIFSDHFSIPQGDDVLIIDPWILHGGLSIEEAEQALQAEGISYQRSETEDQWHLNCDNGVRLGFIRLESITNCLPEGYDPKKWSLWLIRCSRPDVLPEREPERQISITVTKSEMDRLRQLAQARRISVGKLCAEYVRARLSDESGGG